MGLVHAVVIAEFRCAAALLCPKDNVPMNSFSASGSSCLCFLFQKSLGCLVGGAVDVLLRAEHSEGSYSPHLGSLWVPMWHHLLKIEASLMRVERCLDP